MKLAHRLKTAVKRKLTLLVDLPVVDLLLDGVVGDQPVDVGRLQLTVAVHPTHRLKTTTEQLNQGISAIVQLAK
jgi:hypothetical protein